VWAIFSGPEAHEASCTVDIRYLSWG